MFNQDNFFIASQATFKGCKIPHREPDFVSLNRVGNVSSSYWYTDEGVIRSSDHWSLYRTLNDGKSHKLMDEIESPEPYGYGWQSDMKRYDKMKYSSNHEFLGCNNIRQCFWTLKTNNPKLKEVFENERVVLAGFCPWSNFKKR